MAYPFVNPAESFKDLIKPLSELAYTDNPHDDAFPGRLPGACAYAFDKIKERVCVYRSQKAKQQLRSADALLIGQKDSQVHYYLIDFKNQKVDNIQSVKDPGRNELMQKAFDSLSVLAMTFGRDMSMRELQSSSTFIVVYPKYDYSIGFQKVLSECAANEPLWHLDKLIRNNFYSDIKTLHDEDFCKLQLPYITIRS